jgi:hypothetical protein
VHLVRAILSFDEHDITVKSSVRSHRSADISDHQLQQSFYSKLTHLDDIKMKLIVAIFLGVIVVEICNHSRGHDCEQEQENVESDSASVESKTVICRAESFRHL